jgi:hypothetical protein
MDRMDEDLPLFVVLDGGELEIKLGKADRFNGGMLALLLVLLLPSPIALLLLER